PAASISMSGARPVAPASLWPRPKTHFFKELSDGDRIQNFKLKPNSVSITQFRPHYLDAGLFYRDEFLDPRVGWSDLRDIKVTLRVQGHTFDKIELAGLMSLATDGADFFAVFAVENPNFSINAIGDIQELLFGIAREHRCPYRSLAQRLG